MKKKNLLLFAPLAVFALALPSCGSKTTKNYELKRVSYPNHSNWGNLTPWGSIGDEAGFGLVINNAKNNQYNKTLKQYRLKDHGLSKATVTTNVDVSISGQGTIIIYNQRPIDINSIAGQIADTTKTSWDIEKEYLKSEDSLGGSNYIIKGSDGKYWRCFTTGIKDDKGKETKYKLDISTYVNKIGFENVALIEAASNSGIQDYLEYDPDTGEGYTAYLGLDITGFSESFLPNPDSKFSDEDLGFLYGNLFNMGTWLTTPIEIKSVPMPFTLLDMLDVATLAVNELKLDVDLVDFAYDGNKNGLDATKGSVDFGLHNENLNIIKDIVDEIGNILSLEGIDLPFNVKKSNGSGTANYFLAYENNFIRQQEILVNLKKFDFTLTPNLEVEDPLPLIVDLDGVNVEAVINEDVKAGSCDFDEINLADFTEIKIPEPEPGLL